MALGSLAVVGLHVVDDSFLQPEPGTSALDHLAGGLISLAALGLAAVGIPSWPCRPARDDRAGHGLFALVIGAGSAGYTTITVGASGDDFTGLLVLPAGLALIGVGIATLWRSRKLNDRRRWRYTRRAPITVAAPVLMYGTVAPLAFGYIITHVMRQTVPAANLGAAHEDVSFKTSDSLQLRARTSPRRTAPP